MNKKYILAYDRHQFLSRPFVAEFPDNGKTIYQNASPVWLDQHAIIDESNGMGYATRSEAEASATRSNFGMGYHMATAPN